MEFHEAAFKIQECEGGDFITHLVKLDAYISRGPLPSPFDWSYEDARNRAIRAVMGRLIDGYLAKWVDPESWDEFRALMRNVLVEP